ncbi:MAG TPA: hypothetical protein VF101_13395 [Gaiellaceae bacterium]
MIERRRRDPPPVDLALRLARQRFWKDERLRLIATHHDWPDAAWGLHLEPELAHAFVLVLSRLPKASRADFAEAFYGVRRNRRAFDLTATSETRLAIAATVVLHVLELVERPDICTERVVDLLHGAAQRDDLTRTPPTALGDLRKALARIRLELDYEDPSDPRGAAALALAEVLDPASDVVALQEVLARAAFAAVERCERSRVLGFLLEADGLFAEASE